MKSVPWSGLLFSSLTVKLIPVSESGLLAGLSTIVSLFGHSQTTKTRHIPDTGCIMIKTVPLHSSTRSGCVPHGRTHGSESWPCLQRGCLPHLAQARIPLVAHVSLRRWQGVREGAEEEKTLVGGRHAQELTIQMRDPDKHAVWKVARLPEVQQPSECR